MSEPNKHEVDRAFFDVAARSLDGKPTGSSVRVSECTGFKKMGFWWVVQVHGSGRLHFGKFTEIGKHNERTGIQI